MARSPRVYGGETADERTARRRQQLIDAARELLRTEGWGATSMRSVCAKAGLGDRYFYESFRDRDALLSAVFDEIERDAVERVGRALVAAGEVQPARASAAIGALIELIEDDAATRRALFETPDSQAIHTHRRRALRTFAVLVAGELGATAPGKADEVDRELTAHALIGAFQELLTAATEGEIAVPRERLIAHAAAITGAVARVSSR
ncbi:TetR/AcrR family transcriptional regulator [Svornostia abyssi]|uniref:TetR/AcrR family transcriptional regulator n=1 Tax=Svornostia abyssi TaxID=2898438 RepID=A0ABY5PGN0_9ACTN|nr:TetR/AcrR family transcriptional regulator [Parviterribacteraceae bacterium J379]